MNSAVLITVKRKTIQRLLGLPAPRFKTDSKCLLVLAALILRYQPSPGTCSSREFVIRTLVEWESNHGNNFFLSNEDHSVDSRDESRMSS